MVQIDFGAVAFNGDARWLQIAARSPAGSGVFTTLAPRQPITAVPYALQTRGLFVDTARNIGIGTTNTTSLLTVGSPTNRGTLNIVGSSSVIPLMSLTDSRPGGHQYTLYGGLTGLGSLDIFHQNAAATRLTINSVGNVGIRSTNPQRSLQIGDASTPNSEGMIRLASHSGTGGSNRTWDIGAPETDEIITGPGYSFVIDDTYLGTQPEVMVQWGTGNVGIGTTAPGQRLTVVGETGIGILRSNGAALEGLFADPPFGVSTSPPNMALSAGALSLFGPAGNTRLGVRSRFLGGLYHPNQAELFMDSSDGTRVFSVQCVGEGPGANAWVSFYRLDATVKNFRVPNPDNDEEDITYASLEGPECGMYMRGTASLAAGRAHVDLPATFSSIASKEGLTVILTPLSGDSRGLACVNRSINGFEVVELMQGAGTYEFDWEIKAVRRGLRDYKVLHPWTERPMGDGSLEEMWKRRVADIEQRNAKFAQEDMELGPRW